MCLYGVFQVAKGRIMQVQSPKDENSDQFVHQKKKIIAPLKNLGNFTQIQKKIHLNQRSNARDMTSRRQAAKLKRNLERGLEQEL